MEGEISANSTVATEAEAFSVELAAPDGWKKKFTPKKGGTPRRNVIVFISPTGEEITNKRQLDQYLRAHPGGPPPSEFDWGTGDTPRRSARLGAKAKSTETPEGEKPTKRERKTSGKRGQKDKKDTEGGENEVPKAEQAAAAADEANESTDIEMKDTEGNADKAEGEAQKVLVEKTNENGEQKTEGLLVNESSGPEVDRKEAEKANQEKDVCKTSEGKEDENAEKKMEDSEMLIPTLGVKEGAAAADEAKESTDVEMKDTEGNADKAEGEAQKVMVEETNENGEQKTEGLLENESSGPVVEDRKEAEKANQEKDVCKTSEGKEDENAEKKMEDSEMLILTLGVKEGAAAADEAEQSTDVEMKDTEGNANKAEGEAQKVLVEKTNENGEQKTEGHLENESSGPVVEDRKEAEKANQEKEVSKTFEGKEDENEQKRTEDSEMLIPTLGVKDTENAQKEKHEDSVALPQKQPTEKESENADKKTEDSDILLPASEGKENENADKKTDDSDILPPASGGKENENTEKEKPEDYVALPQAQRAMSYNDGQHQPKASPVNC